MIADCPDCARADQQLAHWPKVGASVGCENCGGIWEQTVNVCPHCGSESLFPIGAEASGRAYLQLQGMIDKLDEVL